MVETSFTGTGGVTGITIRAVVNVSADAVVFIIHVGPVVLMTIDAGELGITCGVRMAVGTAAPLTIMFSGVNWERLGIMVFVFSRFPSRIGGVAVVAGG